MEAMETNAKAVAVAPAREGLFHPAPVATLRPESGCHFALYLGVPWRSGQRYILYKAAHIDLSEKKRRELLANGVTTLYVRDDDAGDYYQYVDQTIGQMMVSGKMSPKERSHILYETTQSLVKTTFERPDSPLLISTNRKVVQHTVTALVAEPSMMRTMASLFAYDYSLYTHSVHVSVLGTGLLLETGTHTAEELRDIAMGYLLHDIGKSRVPAEIVRKPGMLTPLETRQMERHPVLGVDLMQHHEAMTPQALGVVRHHHEKLNGNGYPQRLSGAAIPVETRICSVVDIFDALTSHRVYKPALSGYDALRHMFEHMTHELDREIMELLTRRLGPKSTRTV
jgi:HD-GYP domain-containing protein (c-di-GMP phosphodiesterase class II)